MEPLPTVDVALAELSSLGVSVPAGRVRVDGYGDSASLSQELLELIRTGRKRAGASLLWALEADGQALPEVGDIEIVLNHLNRPSIITRIVQVEVAPFCDVTADYAAADEFNVCAWHQHPLARLRRYRPTGGASDSKPES